MVTCAAIGCESNSKASKELNISLYRLPREETLHTVSTAKIKSTTSYQLRKDFNISNL